MRDAQVVLSLGAAFIGWLSITMGSALKADQSAKLMAQTYLLVTFSAPELGTSPDVLYYALTRIAGALRPALWGCAPWPARRHLTACVPTCCSCCGSRPAAC